MWLFLSPQLPVRTALPSHRPLICSRPPIERSDNSIPKDRQPRSQPYSSLSNPTYALTDELRALLRKNHVREAIIRLEEELEANPTSPIPLIDYRYLHEIITICNQSNRWELALRAFRILESLGYSVSRSTSSILFRALIRAGRVNEAETVLSSLWDSTLILADGSEYVLDEREMNRRLPDERMVTQVANGAVDVGKPEATVRMLQLMEQNGVPLTLFSISVLIKAFGRQGSADRITDVLDKMVLTPDVIVLNSAIDGYIRCREPALAMEVLQGMSKFGLVPNARSYNPVMRQLAKTGKMDAVFDLYNQMVERRITPSARTLNVLIQACVCAKEWQKGRELIKQLNEADPDPRARVTKDYLVGYTTLISGFAKDGDMEGAEELLLEMVEEIGRSGKARMYEVDIGIALTAILSALLAQDKFVKAWILFRSVRRKFKIRLPPDMYNAVIRGLVKRGDGISLDAARRVFDEMMQIFQQQRNPRRRDGDTGRGDPSHTASEARPSDIVRAYNSIIDGFVRLGDTTSGESYLDDMEDNGHEPSVVTYTTLINGYGKEMDISSVRRVFKRMQRAGVSPDRVTMNAFLGACVRCGEVERAVQVFEQMQRVGGRVSPNLTSFSALIAGFIRAGKREEAWEAYEEMKGIGIVPNERVLDRMMVAFVSPDLKPTRGEAWSDLDEVVVQDVEIVEEEEEEDVVIEVVENDAGDEETEDEDFEELGRKDIQLEDLRKKIEDNGGWASKRAMILLDDMERCKCSDISKQRWRMALEKVWA